MGISSQFIPETQDQPLHSGVARRARRGDTGEAPNHSVLAATLEKMADEWRTGVGRPAELWLAEHAELAADPEDAVRIVYEEFCLREDHGEQLDSEQYYRRFPQWHDQLAVVLQCHQLLRSDDLPRFPEAGETLGELQLISELGRGAVGRVFLATQPSLSDRPLAVKITPRHGQEHLSLARLQHTHIVPLYLAQDFPKENLRAICMPYLGGATWGTILKRLQKVPLSQRSGEMIVQKLAEAQNAKSSPAVTGPAISFLSQSSYVDAVCWIGACLTDALSYAHQRGLVHLDLKPSNVLLTSDGQPMLLDFHIASDIAHLRSDNIDRLGGTLEYMSPEQRAAAEAIRRGDTIGGLIGAASDIYSLGVLLYESLAGRLPPADPTALREELQNSNPRVSCGLADILCKCMARDPAARYSDAGQLATDLRCHLASLPLRGVSNRSFAERWRKWRRRKPYAMALMAISAAALIVIGTAGGLFYRDRTRTAEGYIVQAQQELDAQQFAAASEHARAAWSALSLFPWQADLRNRLKQQMAEAQQGQATAALHRLVEQLRFLDSQPLTDRNLSDIDTGCARVWENRQNLFASAAENADDSRTKTMDESLRRDLLDLAVISARIDVQLATSDQLPAARRRALERLEEARQLCGSNPWLDLEELDYRPETDQAASTSRDSLPEAITFWEHYDLGRWLARHGSLADAQRQFSAGLEQSPEEFWAHYQLMLCNFQLHRFEQALTEASICVALAPKRAECFYNRALCQQSLDHDQEALADYGRSLELEPTFGAAELARGILFGHLKRYAEAKADFNSAAAHGMRSSEVCFQLARLSLLEHESGQAIRWLQKSLADDPHHAGALALQTALASKANSSLGD